MKKKPQRKWQQDNHGRFRLEQSLCPEGVSVRVIFFAGDWRVMATTNEGKFYLKRQDGLGYQEYANLKHAKRAAEREAKTSAAGLIYWNE